MLVGPRMEISSRPAPAVSPGPPEPWATITWFHVELGDDVADHGDELRLVDAHHVVGAPAGLMSGPMMVKKIVLMPSASSGKNTFSMMGWKLGA